MSMSHCLMYCRVPSGDDVPEWPQYDVENEHYMHIGDKLLVKDHYQAKHMSFWTDKFPSFMKQPKDEL